MRPLLIPLLLLLLALTALNPVLSKSRNVPSANSGRSGSSRRAPNHGRSSSGSSSSSSSRKQPSKPQYNEDFGSDYSSEDDDGFYEPPPPKRGSRSKTPARTANNRPGRPPQRRPPPRPSATSQIGPYIGKAAASGTAFLTTAAARARASLPPAATIAAHASVLSNTIVDGTGKYFREVKGMMSSELEQVLLKATRPSDGPVKAKHAERLVGVTYQISGEYDLYDPILRKLWSKMCEADWRTNIKALYVLHRFAADGSPAHKDSLKARMRELRRTRDPKRKDKFFNVRQLMEGGKQGEKDGRDVEFKQFMGRYASYVLLRTQCFGGQFTEISGPAGGARGGRGNGRTQKKGKEALAATSTSLRAEHLEAVKMLLKSGCACRAMEGELCDNTAVCLERVGMDLNALAAAVAGALSRALKGGTEVDGELLRKWCEFYKLELMPQVKEFVKESGRKLDQYGLFIGSSRGQGVSEELLTKGLSGGNGGGSVTGSATGSSSKAAAAVSDEKEDDTAETEGGEKQEEEERKSEEEEEHKSEEEEEKEGGGSDKSAEECEEVAEEEDQKGEYDEEDYEYYDEE